jgi:hypothetical protein
LNSLQDWQLFHRRSLVAEDGTLRTPVVPLISSVDRGPLGVCQLPRTWLKVSLHGKSLLHPDYPASGPGLDQRVLDLLDLDREEVIAFIQDERPSYLDLERWVSERATIDDAAISEWNTAIRDRVHEDEKRANIHATLGRKDDGTLRSAVILNHVEDWHLAHQITSATPSA